jgi:hypothetical protein
MAVSKDSLRGFTVTTAALWVAALFFAVAADQHYDGVLSADIASEAPRNFLDFQSQDVFFQAAFVTLLLGLHWFALAWRLHTWRGFWAANIALWLALASIVIGWADKLLDDYYHLSFFCLRDGERVQAIDVSWSCEAAYNAREVGLPLAGLVLLIVSFALRLTRKST